jgi:hypothetical protein
VALDPIDKFYDPKLPLSEQIDGISEPPRDFEEGETVLQQKFSALKMTDDVSFTVSIAKVRRVFKMEEDNTLRHSDDLIFHIDMNPDPFRQTMKCRIAGISPHTYKKCALPLIDTHLRIFWREHTKRIINGFPRIDGCVVS